MIRYQYLAGYREQNSNLLLKCNRPIQNFQQVKLIVKINQEQNILAKLLILHGILFSASQNKPFKLMDALKPNRVLLLNINLFQIHSSIETQIETQVETQIVKRLSLFPSFPLCLTVYAKNLHKSCVAAIISVFCLCSNVPDS